MAGEGKAAGAFAEGWGRRADCTRGGGVSRGTSGVGSTPLNHHYGAVRGRGGGRRDCAEARKDRARAQAPAGAHQAWTAPRQAGARHRTEVRSNARTFAWARLPYRTGTPFAWWRSGWGGHPWVAPSACGWRGHGRRVSPAAAASGRVGRHLRPPGAGPSLTAADTILSGIDSAPVFGRARSRMLAPGSSLKRQMSGGQNRASATNPRLLFHVKPRSRAAPSRFSRQPVCRIIRPSAAARDPGRIKVKSTYKS